MINAQMVKRVRFTKEELKAAGIDPQAKICPKHPNIVSAARIKDIILVPYKTTKYDKLAGKDIVVAMGLSCPRCGNTIKADLAAQNRIEALPAKEGQEAPEGVSPTAPRAIQL